MAEYEQLTTKQKNYLRGLGHHLQPVILVGQQGLSDSLFLAVKDALLAHELIKIKVGQNCPLDKEEAARLLADGVQAALVQRIGRMVLLFRANPERDQDRRIALPG